PFVHFIVDVTSFCSTNMAAIAIPAPVIVVDVGTVDPREGHSLVFDTDGYGGCRCRADRRFASAGHADVACDRCWHAGGCHPSTGRRTRERGGARALRA